MTCRRGVNQVIRAAWACLLFGAGMGACAQIIDADPIKGLLPSSVDGGASSTGVATTTGDNSASSASGQGSGASTSTSTGGVGGGSSTASSSSGAGPTCTDGIKNGDETGLDCGGSVCPKCADCTACAGSGDCESGCCTQGICIRQNDGCATELTCADGCQDGQETDVDCGGVECNVPCEIGKGCALDADCISMTCSAEGACAEPPPVP
jgi:hypothetical protein